MSYYCIWCGCGVTGDAPMRTHALACERRRKEHMMTNTQLTDTQLDLLYAATIKYGDEVTEQWVAEAIAGCPVARATLQRVLAKYDYAAVIRSGSTR